MMTICPCCKGPIEQRRVEHVHRWDGELYILRNVPADVCTQCDEVFFGPDALKSMDDVVTKNAQPEGHRSVPVFSL